MTDNYKIQEPRIESDFPCVTSFQQEKLSLLSMLARLIIGMLLTRWYNKPTIFSYPLKK